MRLIVQRDHMQTDFRFQLSLFIIKLGKKKFCGYYRIRLRIWYALFPLQNRNWPLNHCLNFCCPWNMIVNSLNVPVLLWSLTTSSLTFFLVLSESVPQKSQSVWLNRSLGLFKSILKNLGRKWTAGWCKRDKVIGLFCQWSIPQVDLWRWVTLCIITMLMTGRWVRYTQGRHRSEAHCEHNKREGGVIIGQRVSTKFCWPFKLSLK